ncbi:MAG TPA: hypothetical protein VJ837_05620 [Candidatus Paceibacterota bacterium]|nr:hypothetical protein [Candidatus Paceibacterota bacterium]
MDKRRVNGRLRYRRSFVSDVKDRLVRRSGRVAAFADMPTEILLADEDNPDGAA